MTLGGLHNFSVPPFPQLENGDKSSLVLTSQGVMISKQVNVHITPVYRSMSPYREVSYIIVFKAFILSGVTSPTGPKNGSWGWYKIILDITVVCGPPR